LISRAVLCTSSPSVLTPKRVALPNGLSVLSDPRDTP
jgi:hypothetical protein